MEARRKTTASQVFNPKLVVDVCREQTWTFFIANLNTASKTTKKNG